MTMGEKILKLRKARGWNQEDLAEQIGVTRQAVSRWESDSAKPDADKIVAICDLFGVSADYLLRENYQGEPGGVPAQPQRQRTAIGEAMHNMTLKQWIHWGIFALGALMLLVLRFIYIFQDTNYSYHGTHRVYSGYMGFVLCEELGFLHYGAWGCILYNVIRIACKWLRRQAGEFFCWD